MIAVVLRAAHIGSAVAIFFFLGCTRVSADAIDPSAAELDWIKSNAIPLATVQAGEGFADLEPLRKLIGDARIVALGEGTHGTKEFFQVKHRLVEFLASELGFSVFSIEACMPESYRVDDFVQQGEGDPKELLEGMYFWTWNTQEVLDMILWMRAFNASGRGHLEFTGFDMQTPDVAMTNVTDFVDAADPDFADDLHQIFSRIRESKPRAAGRAFGVATGEFPLQVALGHKIVYSGWIKTEDVAGGEAGLWWRIDGESGPLGFDNMHGRGPSATTEWRRYTIDLDVPANATNINFGALLTGSGQACFDDLQVTIDGTPFDASAYFECEFESGEARGFYTGGQGYDVSVDPTAAHSGRKGLQMVQTGAAPPPAPEAMNPTVAAQLTKDVFDHLRSHRTEYVRQRSEQEVEWVIQNARVVWQSSACVAGEATRDESMAENIRWIIEHSPADTKIVLWAHNGHVRRSAAGLGFTPMGNYLSEWYGDDMVALGLASHNGEYTAIKQGQGLQVNKLAPSSEGSAEYVFHRTGLDRFILDLRRTRDKDPASAWLTQSVLFRSIGAIALDQSFHPTTLTLDYDGLLYIDQTQATDCFGLSKQ